jgi:para-aminobenzoate synthetase/4-amino-4-deoxychorismate lyase
LFNEKGEVTESCIANVAIRAKDATYVTPPVSCGLLAGTMRQALLTAGAVREKVITVAEIMEAKRVILFNSVRGIWEGLLS